MVLVDVFVPSVDKTYNFSLNENVTIDAVILEITEMIEQKERTISLSVHSLEIQSREKVFVLENMPDTMQLV